MASCLPGSESSAKRAETSAIRPEPLVMTMKLTIEITAKTVMPTISEPPATNSENPLMTSPAASGPVWPSVRMSRVDETFSDRRISSEMSSITGKAWKSVGRVTTLAMTRISVAVAIDSAMPTSSSAAGIGMTIDMTTRTSAPVMTSGFPDAPIRPLTAETALIVSSRTLGPSPGAPLPVGRTGGLRGPSPSRSASRPW